MAHKKAGGTAKNVRDSNPKMLGIKLFGGQFVKIGGIIVRQRGTKYEPGLNVKVGKDHTIFAMTDGFIKFTRKNVKRFTGELKKKTLVNVVEEIKK